ncbi:polysaccharide pyruvyl transferase family protein [Vibrio algivorus]|uniref:Polysaccharide pyruvyl transferase family protein n=1 Tax=Vibrio algivorus TaxID=1667024 RepID=A0A557P5L3_9VIBR|nr:polysaccharide pyruvyl transferase family protein [Vibrio algivorus]TVO35951.1 polysaccharide pyruvyl transferase family protein [Vibrio algivorus]
MSLKLEYSIAKNYNFGDDLNPWLWPKLLGEILGDSNDRYFLGIGTILTEKRINQQLKDAKEIVIFSSGSWGEKSCPKLTDNCKVYGVRGPRTAKLLGLDESFVVGDGAYLVTQVDYPKAQKIKGRVAFIPHHKSEDYIDWVSLCESIGLTFISTKQPVEDFLIALQQCEYVISEAMHGAIMADVLRIPWVGVSYSPLFEYEKWFDFSEALNIKLDVRSLPFITNKRFKISKNLKNSAKRLISKIATNNEKWNKNPILWRKSSSSSLNDLCQELNLIKSSNKWQLSDEQSMLSIIEKQNDALKLLIKDYSL